MLIIRDKRAVSAEQAASIADRFQRVLEIEAASAGYELRSFEIELDRQGSDTSSQPSRDVPAGNATPTKP